MGMSLDVDRRFKDHNTGQCKSTKAYKPWNLMHIEEFPDRLTARKREKYLKSGYGKQWLKQKYK